MSKRIITGLLMITLLSFFGPAGTADNREDITMQVTASLPSGAPVTEGQLIEFTVEIANNTDQEETVTVSDMYRSWSQEVVVGARATEQITVDHTVPNTVPGGSMMIFNFTGKVGDNTITIIGADNYIYTMPKNDDIIFTIEMGKESEQIIGGVVTYYAKVTNNGNTNIQNIRIEQSLDPHGAATIDVLLPDQSTDRVLEYRIPPESPVGQDVTNIFTLTGQGIGAIEHQLRYKVSVTGLLNIAVVTEPTAYVKGSLIEIKVIVENPSDININGALVRNGSDTRMVGNVAAGEKKTVTFHHLVTVDNEQLNFAVQDQQNNSLAAVDYNVLPMDAVIVDSVPAENEIKYPAATEAITEIETQTEPVTTAIPTEAPTEAKDPWDSVISGNNAPSVPENDTGENNSETGKGTEDLAAVLIPPPQTGQIINRTVIVGFSCTIMITLMVVITTRTQKHE